MLELANPSAESSVNKERWKEFIDEPTAQSCGVSENYEGYSVNKAKRTFTEQSLDIPSKIPRSDNIPINIEKPLPLLYSRDNLNRLFGAKTTDSLALIGEIMQKETAFKIKVSFQFFMIGLFNPMEVGCAG
ncbi:hypothetical protein TELCIR_26079 [Teladorsagia circumcincta]|uniref:Uncharacterized protein n=1 Tax=Teladorsagia circumcincta TaxID=45464 RepID=A0A2G9T3T4_TELCI|nr:hypothetical protein TELCIR_26079 [Teladorsagia circumcincta]